MDHAAIASHLRHEVIETTKFETGRLIGIDAGLSDQDPGWAYFGAVRAVLCDLDYVSALYVGFDRINRRQIATAAKAVEYIQGPMADATNNVGYRRYGQLLYGMYRHGTVHIRAPKRFRNTGASTELLAWTVLGPPTATGPGKTTPGPYHFQHLIPWHAEAGVTTLPVSIVQLYEDFLASVEHYIELVEDEGRSGLTELRDRWRSTADALCQPEQTDLLW